MFVLGGGCDFKTFHYKLIRQLFHLWSFQTIDISMRVITINDYHQSPMTNQ
jgi:hypothetical protein